MFNNKYTDLNHFSVKVEQIKQNKQRIQVIIRKQSHYIKQTTTYLINR